MFPVRKCQVMFPSNLSQDVSAFVRFRYVSANGFWYPFWIFAQKTNQWFYLCIIFFLKNWNFRNYRYQNAMKLLKWIFRTTVMRKFAFIPLSIELSLREFSYVLYARTLTIMSSRALIMKQKSCAVRMCNEILDNWVPGMDWFIWVSQVICTDWVIWDNWVAGTDWVIRSCQVIRADWAIKGDWVIWDSWVAGANCHLRQPGHLGWLGH